MIKNQWNGFVIGEWNERVDVRDFIQKNYTPYYGDGDFLEGMTEKTEILFNKSQKLIEEELTRGIMDVDTENISGINNFKPGYLDKENEVIVGFQTDAPLKRMINPYGGERMVEEALKDYGFEANPKIKEIFNSYRKTHNQGVFDAYTKETRLARKTALLTGLPDAYGRGRIIGDYRRVALYGIDLLQNKKKEDLDGIKGHNIEETIRLREETSEQIRALSSIKAMALSYGYDISNPAESAREAVQFIYFAYLAAIKENNGAAMSFGRTASFIDIYIERDLKNGVINEKEAQEIIDQLVLKLRMVRHLRTPEYNELFGGDPNWVTESIGGMGEDKRTLVTKNSFRFLHTLINLGAAPEPNMTVLWSQDLPENFKNFCSGMSITTNSVQYENDDLMRPIYGDDYAIACCVSAMKIGKQMQYFGARCNIAKALLYAINGGVDEITAITVVPGIPKLENKVLDYEKVMSNYIKVLEYVAELYVDTVNTIHYMHDKYAYEASQMAFHDLKVERLMAFGIAGLSVAADSLSAIKYAKVSPIREKDIAVDFNISGEFPMYGNDDDRVDEIAIDIVSTFSKLLKRHEAYRQARHTLSVLTITSNVVYGKKTGSTPDGRKAGEPFAPGANPMHGREHNGMIASLNSVAKIPYKDVCEDGISNTFSVVPATLGSDESSRIKNLTGILDGYFVQDAHHLNVNVLDRETLMEAMDNPKKYPNLTIRVSGYAVHFNRLSRIQQLEVVKRTFH